MAVTRINEAFALMAQGEVARASEVLGDVLRSAPGYAPAYVLYAQASEALHQWPRALQLWQSAALLAPALGVAQDGILRATRVMAALQALEERTAPADTAAAAPVDAFVPDSASPERVLEVPQAGSAPAEPEAQKPSSAALEKDSEAEEQAAAPPVAVPLGRRAFNAPPPPPPAGPPARYPAATDIDLGQDSDPPPPAEEADNLDDPQEPSAAPTGAVFNAPPPPPALFESFVAPADTPPSPRNLDLDLDALIDQLNAGGRIRPRADVDDIPPPVLDDDIEDVVSETLARIYATQGQFDEAARIYELLAAQQPANAEAFMQEATRLRNRAGD